MSNKILYNIEKSEEIDGVLYEQIESGGQHGVRCRKYVTKDELFADSLYKYDMTKYGYHFRKFISKRYPLNMAYKFEAFSWCWPLDKFDYAIGKEKAKEKLDIKIKTKIDKIKKFVKNLEKHNLKNTFYFKHEN